MSAAAFAGIALVHLMAAISPGPSFVLAVRTAAAEGFGAAAALALGFGLGATVWAAAALLGLAFVFELAPLLLSAMKVAGGLFLVWLAWGLWSHAREPMPVAAAGSPPRSAASAVRLGLMSMLANPKPAVFFGAVFVGLVPREAAALDKAVILVNILWVEAAWYVVVAWAFSLPRARAGYARAKTALDRTFGGALAALGIAIAAT
jgi:threonine/homoserine/homoserine lactone efflux protein